MNATQQIVRAAGQARRVTPANPANPAPAAEQREEEPMTAEKLEEEYPELVEEIRAKARAEAEEEEPEAEEEEPEAEEQEDDAKPKAAGDLGAIARAIGEDSQAARAHAFECASLGMTPAQSRAMWKGRRAERLGAEAADAAGRARPAGARSKAGEPGAKAQWDNAVQQAMAEHDGDRGAAVRRVVRQQPELHRRYIEEINRERRGE